MKTIGLVISTLNNPFFVTLKNGAEEKAKELGYKIIVEDSQNDSSKELSNVEDLIQQKVDVLLINPVDSDAVVTAIKEANSKNIPVITIDRSANGGDVVCHIASDNVKGGEMAAEFIAKALKGKGNVVELEGIPGASAARDRGKGFDEAIAKYPDIKIVAKQAADFDRSKGLSVMENILQAQPKIDAVFAQNDEMALGAIKAIEAANRQGIIVVGFDGTEDALKAIKEGKMAATIAQQPALMGSLGVEMADKYLKGEKIPNFIPAELKLITKENVQGSHHHHHH
uniref:Periplasmic sugar-binding protein n=1 Tax=Caldanaerobacter subterraneus subsp. tengcongensis TaxID=119072 RepID=UPI0000F53435|nr:Chain A, Periplasmic sugar-binding protein [Caldanaerobacter subterraneus subsp. tengcongensis]2IOY_B Chain B, Periplasmic sugar-binding protein [Caldanaerobacter subterraneus subsp. tengcongensis]